MSYLFNGNVNVINEVEVKNDTGNPLPVVVDNTDPIDINVANTTPIEVEIANTTPIDVNVTNDVGTPLNIAFPPTASDAFGRLRVSTPYTLFDSQHRYVANDKWSNSTAGGATVSHDANASLVNMNVGTASGAQVLRESTKVMAYQPGKSLLVLSTFKMNAPKANLRQRAGYFGAANGIYFQIDDSTISFVLRSSSSGVLSENAVAKASWNYDKLDGSGPSGLNITDFSNSIILFIDIEWLGVGDVRCGFVLNGQFVICHIFRHTPGSITPITSTFMGTACLPLRLEITNKASTDSSSTLKHICNSVLSEAGYELSSRAFHQNLGTSDKRLNTADTTYPVISIKLNSSYLDSIIVLKSLSIILASNQICQFLILLNPTLTSPTWVQHECLSVDYDISASAISGGSALVAGYIDKAGVSQLGSATDFNFQLGRSIAGVSDIITLAATPFTANTDVLADLAWYKII